MKDFVTVTENYTDRQTDTYRQTDRHNRSSSHTDKEEQSIVSTLCSRTGYQSPVVGKMSCQYG